MATLAEIARARRADLRLLLKASRKLDAAQETLEREVKRLVNRKNSVPEQADAIRILEMTKTTDNEVASFAQTVASLSAKWRAT